MKSSILSFLSIISFLFSYSVSAQLVFQNNPTGENMTILLNLTTTPTVGTIPIDSGDYIGAFFTDTSGDLVCGGFTTWNGNPSQAISFPVYEDDNSTTLADGFETGDDFIWKVKTLNNGFVYDATATYNNSSPFSSTYINDGFAQITNLTISATLVPGCTDSLYLEYNPLANADDGSCATLKVNGCTDPGFLEFNANANVDDGSCATPIVNGCTDTAYLEYNMNANVDDGSCTTLKVYGCTDNNFVEFNPAANVDNGTCLTAAVFGCTDTAYIDFNPAANVDDGSCSILKVYGCTNPAFLEYDPAANVNNGTCLTFIIEGCTDSTANNYNANANVDDGSCDYSCNVGFIEVSVQIVTGNDVSNSSWGIWVDGIQLDGQTSVIIPANSDNTYHYCIEQGANVEFNSSNLNDFNIIRCGFQVQADASNPNQANFVANCINIGIDEENNSSIFMYPNPVKDNVNISSENKIDEIQIINVLGETIWLKKNPNSTLNVSSLSPGVYKILLQVNNQLITKSIIKM